MKKHAYIVIVFFLTVIVAVFAGDTLRLRDGAFIATGSAFSPTNTYAWFRSDLGITLQGGTNTVQAWADQSGNGRDVIDYLNNQPSYVSSVLNGYPALRSNSIFTMLVNTNSPTSASAEWTVFFVATCGTNQEQYATAVSFAKVGSARWALQMGSDAVDGIGWAGTIGTVDLGPRSLTTNTAYTRCYIKSSTNWNVYQNGSQIVTNISDSSSLGSPYDTLSVIGEANGSIVGNYSLRGDLFEVLIYNSAFSTTDRLAIESYLKSRYGHY